MGPSAGGMRASPSRRADYSSVPNRGQSSQEIEPTQPSRRVALGPALSAVSSLELRNNSFPNARRIAPVQLIREASVSGQKRIALRAFTRARNCLSRANCRARHYFRNVAWWIARMATTMATCTRTRANPCAQRQQFPSLSDRASKEQRVWPGSVNRRLTRR